MAGLTVAKAAKRFGATQAVADLDLDVADGEFVAILGPSGCGKTTLLRLIAGFEELDAGAIHVGATLVSGRGQHMPAERRRIGVVFQSHALWPHMTVAGNVGYPLRVRGVNGEEYRRRIHQSLATVGLSGLEERRPAELSGGQRQRVALARCLIMEPSLVLLDEPLASLDVHLRMALQDEFASLHKATRATMIYITHDQSEAMALADRIAVMDGGRLVQVASPEGLYREPATTMVARFVGGGTVVPSRVLERERAGQVTVEAFGKQIQVRAETGQAPGAGPLCLRPESFKIVAAGADSIAARVHRVIYRGGSVLVEAIADGRAEMPLWVALPAHEAPAEGTSMQLAVVDGWVIPERLFG
ncbi:MAG: ABC transporter ATP-binding protein [Proteobacteria bacterium]|nr:ABC transporter ATP-binding protein [Pseudomonadota bacterium]MBI3499915.1 ABC transporter ATP-binding protein [Pseudomonadota bacterium]